MTLDEAIKHAEEVADEKKKEACNLYDVKNYEESRECIWCSEEHRQLAGWLKELKQLRKQTSWIPVSKRSPEKSGYYWCTFGGGIITGRDYYTTESDAKEIYDEPEEYTGWRSQNVVAWMPLPESYKAESEGEE